MPDHAVAGPTTTTTVNIDVTAKRVLSYAMANSEIPVVDQVLLTSPADRPGAVLRVLIQDEQGQVTRPFEQVVDLVANRRMRVESVDVQLDPAVMLQIEEQRPGKLIVEVEWHGHLLAQRAEPIRLLAARQWLRDQRVAHLSFEILAAFVMPNDPSVAALLNEASEILRRRTGSAALCGYQRDAQRVDATVQAIFEAVQARRISYSMPPASWADDGQKVRSPQEVLEGRLGTCLDTTVVMAALLEQAWIRPLLWIVEGHAFLGYWRQEKSLGTITQTDVSDLVNRIDLGEIRLVETTMLTGSAQPGVFDRSSQDPYEKYLTGDLSTVYGVTDVWAARRGGILALPSRVRRDDGQVQVIVYEPQKHSSAPMPRERSAPSSSIGSTGTRIPARVQAWKNVLLDLSRSNRLIHCPEQHTVALRVPTGQLGRVEDTLHEGDALQLLPSDQLDEIQRARGATRSAHLPQEHLSERFDGNRQLYTNLADAQYEKRLRALTHSSRTNIDEIGANNLYLALGTLLWKPDGTDLRSPLILVPVRLTRRPQARGYHLELDESGTSTPNFCLLEKLFQEHGLRVPGLAEPAADGAGIDLDAAVRALRVAIADKRLPYRVEASAELATLQFAKFRLWKDLDENWEQLSANTLVHHLMHQPSEPFEDPTQRQQATVDLDELDAVCPLPGDASQLGAVADAVGGRTFVLEGPPGTGKSQTITNMLTRAVVEGQRVLFVAEKRAALDVVRRRLDEVGMGPFCLDLHDKSSKPVHVRAQISQSLNHQVVVDEQDLRAAQQDLRSSRRALARYARGLHEPNAVDYSFYSAHTELIALGDGPVLAVPREFLHTPDVAAKVQAVRDLLRVLPDTADVARPERQHPWGFLLLDDAASLDVERMREAAQHVDDSLGRLPADGPLAGVLAVVRTVEDFSDLSTVIRGRAVPLDIMDESRSQRWQLACGELLGELDSFFTNGHPVLKLVLPAVLDLPLDDIHAQAQQAGESSVIGRARRLRDVQIRLEPVLWPEADVRGRDLPELTGDLLQLREDVRALAQRARSIPGIDIPAGWNPFTEHGLAIVRDHVSWLGALGQAVDPASADPQRQQFIEQLRLLPALAQQIDDTAADAIDEAAGAVQALLGECGSTPELLLWWSGDAGLPAVWRETSAGRALWDHALLSLRRWVAFRQALAPLWGMRLEQAYDELLTGSILADDAAAAFERGLALAARTERGEANRLDVFDAEAHNRAVVRFTTAAARVREHLKTALPAQVLERRTFDAATATGKAGALRKEIRRQRKGLGVRALMSEYGELVTEIMPCVLVSPDSLARFFPGGEQIFDLVVFDEASQIRVADAIGAMGRSRAVVVVGDSKQMPPTSFAQRSLGDEDDDDAVATEATTAPADEESILTECVEARVPQKWLSWHYRSVDESLIAFSNLKYYEGRLSSFPTPNTAGTDCGISLVPVEGTYLRTAGGKMKRTNPQEAQAVVAEIRRRFDATETPPSIGVVTFNAPQRAHIEDLIRDSKDERLIEALDARGPESLFIKNLENVQGDERDTILFSTGFSTNEKGSLPRNFGPLVWFGGERRWNVAITRARRQVMVFSSFTPSQLKVEQTSSAGLQHLRAYLDIAAGDSQVLASSVASAAAPDKHREQLARALRGRGLIVQEVFGLSEFRVELAVAWPDDPQTFLVAVLLDGQEWRHRKTVSDRDGLPVQVLSKMLGWPAVERVWLPEWLVSPENVLDRLEAATRAAAQARPARTRPAAGPSPVRAAARDADLLIVGPPVTPANLPARRPLLPRIIGSHQALPGQETYTPWQPRVIGDRKALDRLPALLPAVAQLIDEIVEAEGPIHRERLARLVAAAFGINRLVAARAEKIYAHLPALYFKDPEEPFLWPAGLMPDTWTTFRRQRSVKPRPLEQIDRHEIGNAMVAIARFTAGLPREQLLREVLGVFGARQMTDKAEERLSIALEKCLLQGRMIEQHGLLLVVER